MIHVGVSMADVMVHVTPVCHACAAAAVGVHAVWHTGAGAAGRAACWATGCGAARGAAAAAASCRSTAGWLSSGMEKSRWRRVYTAFNVHLAVTCCPCSLHCHVCRRWRRFTYRSHGHDLRTFWNSDFSHRAFAQVCVAEIYFSAAFAQLPPEFSPGHLQPISARFQRRFQPKHGVKTSITSGLHTVGRSADFAGN